MPFLMIIASFFIFLIAIIVAYAETPAGIGKLGELRIRFLIGKTKLGSKYIINNLILKTDNERTAQIDHVVINARGVFVIETKNYSGRIYGQENQQEWTQVLQYGKVKNKFYNPIKQNKTHVFHIANTLSSKVPITSAVVFVRGTTQFVNATGVYSPQSLKQLLENGISILSVEQMETIYNELLNANQINISNREHIQNIQSMKLKVEQNICPRCGKVLVKRSGKNGSFWGCIGYPNCKFTKKF